MEFAKRPDRASTSPQPQRDKRRNVRRATIGAGLSLALSATLLTTPAPAAFAAGGSWKTSFEAGQPTSSPVPVGAPVNLTAESGNLGNAISAIEGSHPNPGGESVEKIADADSGSKWFVGVKPTSGAPIWATYTLDQARAFTGYSLTSANDDPGRDPKSWKVEGSNNKTDWTQVDAQSGQTFSDRKTVKKYDVASGAAYKYFRLSITDNNGSGDQFQLADWTLLTASSDTPGPLMLTETGGPSGGWTHKQGAGFTGVRSLGYYGKHIATGAASSTNTIVDGLNVAIDDRSELSYKIYPVLNTGWEYSSTFVAVDLELSDGTRLSAKNLLDTNGFGASARKQGEDKALFANQWNSVKIPLGSLKGKSVKKVLISYDNPGAAAGIVTRGYFDDIAIADVAPIDGSDLNNFVDTRRGSNSNGAFSRGSTIPAASWPNGFNFWTPYTNVNNNTLYQYQASNNAANLSTLQGVGISHETSIWMGDSDQLVFFAGAGTDGSRSARAKAFSHDDEIARPDYYGVTTKDGTKFEMTPTNHGAVLRFTFPSDGPATGNVMVEKGNTPNGSLAVNPDGTISGWTEGHTGGSGNGATRMFVYGSFDRAPTSTGDLTNVTGGKYGQFNTSSDKDVELRVATSFISQGQAQKNFDQQLAGKTFSQVRASVNNEWNDRLGVLDLAGSTANDTQKITTYSNLYRLNLYPNVRFENTGTTSAPVYKYASPTAPRTGSATETATNAPVIDGKMYVNNGFWDTYRTAWPAYSLLYPELAAELVDGFVDQYRDGGWIARWTSPGYSDIMTGTSSDASFADAYVNGDVPLATAKDAYDAALRNATVPSIGNNSVGRKGISTSIFLGYTQASEHESVSWGLEGGINDYGIAKMAAKLATEPSLSVSEKARYKEEAEYFLDRSENYVKMFNPQFEFFTSRNGDGTFPQTSFNPKAWWGAYTETNGWNFAFHAPHDVKGLAGLYGGSAGLNDKLAEFYATPELTTGSIHEELEAAAGRLGQLGMSNQVSHHIPYISVANGDPTTTQKVVRESLQRLFVGSEVGQGYLGDEDNGEMSGWQIFSSLGFYPLALASGEYAIGSPLFDKIKVSPLGGNGSLTINAPGNDHTKVYVKSAKLDNNPLTKAVLPIQAIKSGNHTLDFEVAKTPQTWGSFTTTDAAPHALVDIANSKYSKVTTDAAGVDVTALTDDNSGSWVGFGGSSTPTVNVKVNQANGAPVVKTYTITNGTNGSGGTADLNAPKSWKLQGSNNGTNWVTVDERINQTFQWSRQTRPFQVANPAAFTEYRLAITANKAAGAPTLAEIELLVHPAGASSGEPVSVAPAGDISTAVGAKVGGLLAFVSGAGATSATAVVNYGDGSDDVVANVVAGDLSGATVSADHTFAKPGVYTVIVTVTSEGVKHSASLDVDVKRNESLASAYDSACITVAGIPADCDSNGYAYKKTSLATNTPAFVQGASNVVVPGFTDVKFDIPDIASGKFDNATGRTKTRVRLQLGNGASKVSFIGTANESDQNKTAKIVFADGYVQTVPFQFENWDGAKTFNNVVVGTSNGRFQGTSESTNGVFRMQATAPVALDAGHGEAIWLDLPAAGTGKAAYHLLTVATDGDRTVTGAALALDLAPLTTPVDSAASLTLGTSTGGEASTSHSVMVNWGDGSATTAGTVVDGAVQGSHRYQQEGTYTVTATIDDAVTSITKTATVTVVSKSTTTLALSASASTVDAAGSVSLTATVGGGATGSVKFFDSGVQVGEAAIVAGKAELTVTNLVAGVHSFTAIYEASDTHAGAESSVVTVTAKPAAVQVAVAAPRFSKTSQAYGSVSSKRAKVATVVTGVTSGTVTFKSGSRVLGKAPVTKVGTAYTATLVIPAGTKVGTYSKVTAHLVSGSTSVVSAAGSQVFKVVKATTSKVSVSGKKYKRGSTAKVTVKIAKLSSGVNASGKVTVYVGKKAVKTVKIKSSKKGKIVVSIPKKYTKSKSIKVKAKFTPSSTKTVSAKSSKTVKVKSR